MDELRKGIAIGMLFGSGGEGHGNLMTKTATENGTYTAAEEIDHETGEIFNPPKDGYSVFTVDLPLDDKFVTIVTSAIESSSTGIFEYDPHDENPELEGYSLFRLDLTGVKTDLADLKAQLDKYEECCEQVAEAVGIDPPYEPEEVVEAVEDVVEKVEECDQCKADVIAKLQEYDPDFDPQTCSDIPPEIDAIVEENKGVPVPTGVDPIPIIEELGAKTGVNTSIDGKKVTFEYVGRGYYPVSDNDYTPAQASEPISEYLAINGLYSAFQLAPEPTSVYTYRTWMYSVQIEGFPKYYSFNFASNNQTVPGDNVTGVIISDGRTAFIQTETEPIHGAVFTTASGKSWGTDSELKIY